MSPRVFLDINFGDPDVHARELAQFETTVRFFEQNRAQLGLPEDAALDSLDGDGHDLLIEAFQSRNTSVSPRHQLTPAKAKVFRTQFIQGSQHGLCAG
jgi:hypothetical protein